MDRSGTYTPQTRIRTVGWVGRRFQPGRNKGIFDPELFALYQASKVFDNQDETGQHCTILLDSTAQDNATIEGCSCLHSRGFPATWALALHRIGAEMAIKSAFWPSGTALLSVLYCRGKPARDCLGETRSAGDC